MIVIKVQGLTSHWFMTFNKCVFEMSNVSHCHKDCQLPHEQANCILRK